MDKAVSGAQTHRAAMRRALDHVEHALAVPSQRVNWIASVQESLKSLSVELDAHVAEVERNGGLFSSIMAQAPQLADKIEQLRRDHDELESAIADVVVAVTEEGAAQEPDEVRRLGLELMGNFVRHRHRGADLVYDAYDIDIGGG